jgi:tight adherence protein B
VLAGVFLALLATPLLVFGRLRERDKTRVLDSRIGPYVPAAGAGGGEGPGSALRVVARLLRYRDTDRKLADRLDLAALRRKPAEWVLVCSGASASVMVLLTMVTGNPLAGIVVGGTAGWAGARLTLSLWIKRRRNAFQSQLPDVLELMAGSLRSGLTLARALDAVEQQDLQPISAEFSRALSDVRIGAGVEDALESVAARMDSADLRWAIMAMRIHRTVGGNLVEILQNVMATMREREYLRRQIRSLSAEGRLSAYVLIALPIAIGGWLFYSSPAYMRTMYTTTSGLIMLAGSAGLIVVGTLWMRKLVRIEV